MKRHKATHALRLENRTALYGDFVPEDVHQYRIDRHSFTIYVGGDPIHPGFDATVGHQEPGVEHLMADRFELNLGILSGIDPDRPILVQMASCGGNWEEGMQMFGALLTCPNPVTVLATKWARSMTSLIPLAADRFVIRPPAKYMFHRGSYGFEGLDQEAETDDIERRKANELMFRIYIARLREQGQYSKWSEKKIRHMLHGLVYRHTDVWLTADEAEKSGFADAVFDGDYERLRAPKRNMERRKMFLRVLRTPISVEIRVT